jgi:hypothetical protein
VQHVQQLLDVGQVEAGGGLVEDIDRVARVRAAEFLGQLDPLRLRTYPTGETLNVFSFTIHSP